MARNPIDGDEAAPEALENAQPDEPTDIAAAILEYLQVTSDGAQPVSAEEELATLPDDLLSAALHDAIASNIDQALDQLTSSPDLFDMPAMDFGGDGGDGDS